MNKYNIVFTSPNKIQITLPNNDTYDLNIAPDLSLNYNHCLYDYYLESYLGEVSEDLEFMLEE